MTPDAQIDGLVGLLFVCLVVWALFIRPLNGRSEADPQGPAAVTLIGCLPLVLVFVLLVMAAILGGGE